MARFVMHAVIRGQAESGWGGGEGMEGGGGWEWCEVVSERW